MSGTEIVARYSDAARPLVVIGIGNDYRGDDAAGLEVARRIRDAGLGGVTVLEIGGDPTRLLHYWDHVPRVIVIDAVSSGSQPGTIRSFDALNERLPNIFGPHLTTHGIGVVECVELARSLDQLPEHLTIYGIECRVFDVGTALSPEVARAVEETATRIVSREAHSR